MPRLRVCAGPSISQLKPVRPNTGEVVEVSSDVFDGKLAVYIKSYPGLESEVSDHSYFDREERKDVTWSIQVQGRFLHEYGANDVLFGTVFDQALVLPWGFSTILSFMKYKDPTLEHNLTSQTKPWMLSPFISSMPYLAHARKDAPHTVPAFPPSSPLIDNLSGMRFKNGSIPEEVKSSNSLVRRGYFRKSSTRTSVVFGPEDVITADCCHGHLAFSASGVTLQLPGGFGLDLTRFWQGQPIYFVCCERASGKGDGDQPYGRVFWCVSIEALDEDSSGSDESGDKEDEEEESLEAGAEGID